MSKWQLLFDAARCNSCNNCVLATKDEYLFNRFDGYSAPAPRQGNLWFTLERHERGGAPMIDVTHYISTCHQCVDAPCINQETADVITQREDGIVVIDPVKAVGRHDLVAACPFGHIHWNEAENLAQKYAMDAHLLDRGWNQTRAVQACPTQALTLVKLDDAAMQQMAKREGLMQPPSAKGVGSRTWFRNAGALSHAFLGGTLVSIVDGREDCAADVAVRLCDPDGTTRETRTDAFGDFRFDGLAGGGQTHRLEVLSPQSAALFTTEYTLTESQWVGVIALPAQ